MAEEGTTQEQESRTFTQEEVNAMMGKVRREVTEKFKDYDDLKTKAAAYDESQEAAKSELQKAEERASRAEAELQELQAQKARADLAAKVSAETGVPANLIQGDDEASMTASAQAIATYAKAQIPGAPHDKGGAAGSPKPLADKDISQMKDPTARVMAYASGYEGQ